MTETFAPPAASPRLERPRDAPFQGVCSALARTTGTDAVLWRVLVVVLTFFGGVGIVLYLAGIVLLPREGEQRSLGERLLHGPDRHLRGSQLLLIVLLVIGIAVLLSDRNGVIAVLVAAGLFALWLHDRTANRTALAEPGAAVPAVFAPGASAPGVAGSGPGTLPPPAWTASPPPPPAFSPPPPPRPRSPLTGLTVSLAALVAGVLLLVGAGTGTSIPAEVVLAGALATIGLGLVVGSWWGRSGWLITLAVLLGVALSATVAVRPVVDGGLGERTWVPGGSGSYRLGVGDATLDLRSLPMRASTDTTIDASVDVGHLLVLVPDGARVSLDARAQLGDLLLLGVDSNGRGVSRHLDLGPPGSPQVRLDLRVRTGQVEVRRG